MLKCMLANSSGMSSSCLFESACRELGFKPWAGSNSKRGPRAQPPDLADVLLHETAVSWLRRQEEQTRPTRPWEETPQQLAVRLRQGVSRINKEFDVRGLCMELPGRLLRRPACQMSERHLRIIVQSPRRAPDKDFGIRAKAVQVMTVFKHAEAARNTYMRNKEAT